MYTSNVLLNSNPPNHCTISPKPEIVVQLMAFVRYSVNVKLVTANELNRKNNTIKYFMILLQSTMLFK